MDGPLGAVTICEPFQNCNAGAYLIPASPEEQQLTSPFRSLDHSNLDMALLTFVNEILTDEPIHQR